MKFFQMKGHDVETYDGSFDEEEPVRKIQGVSILGIRSKHQ